MSDIGIDLSNSTNWTKANVTDASYTYNAVTRDFSTCAAGVPVSKCSIAAFESFWIQATGNPSLTINEQAKITTSNINVLHRTAQNVLNYIGIKLSSAASANTNTTFIRYTAGASATHDTYDGLKLGATNRTYLSDVGVYSKAIDKIFYDVNAKPDNFVSDTTELLVKLPVGNATLDFTDITNLETGYVISLYDKYTKTLSDVSTNPVYNFMANADTNSTGPRFQVIFNRTSVTTSTGDITSTAGITIYPSPTDAGNVNITAHGIEANTSATIYDVTGRVVSIVKLSIEAGNVNQRLNLSGLLNEGMYTVVVKSGNNTYHQKVIIK